MNTHVNPELLEIAQQTAPAPNTTRKKLFIALASGVALIGLGFGAYQIFLGSKHVTTDNAYVDTDAAQVNALTNGPVKDVRVVDTQTVHKGDILVVIDDTDRRLAEMTEDFAKLATLRRDVGALFAGFNRALHGLALSTRGEGVQATDAGVNELNEFVTATQAQLDDIERRLVIFRQLRTRLGEVQARLVPLESDEGGVISAIEELKDVRDRLATKISRMEQSEEGSLSERVHKFTESRRQLEERVLHLNEEFLKLTLIRKDISNLFERLSNAVSTSAK